ncbi:hypothetical protein MAR_010067 [Mya arenaria]|uniref:Uncharacterized protein n=1 Tax=Mya arenaria TaxID=6604 RepID=A0ABY7E2S4_MYAAR|nr:uncharacterized protein LOC128232583 [Mya arenaria]WAR03509.1 hypothetical protein MAR_010067 [Mya arenaria]
MLGGKKQQFYVQFLGWVETNGLRGTRYTEPVVNDLRRKAKKWKNAPKLTLQVGKKEMKITQDIQDEKKKGKKIKTIKFPIIPSRDITFAHQSFNPADGSPDDIVACIYLGYVPRTQRSVHVHVYRFDSPDTASTFAHFLNHIVSMHAERTAQIERQLIQEGHIEAPTSNSYVAIRERPRTVRPDYRLESSDGMSDRAFYEDSGAESGSFSDEGFPSGSDDIEPDLQSLKDAVPFDSVTDELKARLQLTETKGAAPLLLPPKDYDTIVRRHGDIDKATKRKCLQIPIVGGRLRNGSDESGIEVPSPTSSEGKHNSIDMSDDRINNSAQISSTRTSSRNSYEVYPAKDSPMSPRGSGYEKFRVLSRQTSSASGMSNRSSGTGNYSAPGTPRSATQMYNGKQHIADIPPADYDNDAPILRQKSAAGGYSHRDLTRSMPASMLQQEMDYGYAVVPKRANRLSARSSNNSPAMSPRVDMDYIHPGPPNVRRVNSMYR